MTIFRRDMWPSSDSGIHSFFIVSIVFNHMFSKSFSGGGNN